MFWLSVLAKESARKGDFVCCNGSEAEGRVCKFERLILRLVKNYVQ